MATRRIQCREHPGGIFTIQVKRGRQPVRCKPDNPCDKHNVETVPPRTVQEQLAPDFDSMTNTELKAYAREHFSTISKITSRAGLIRAMNAQLAKRASVSNVVREVSGVGKVAVVVTEAPAPPNLSAALARSAKERLMPLGWVCKGRAGTDEEGGTWAEMLASRGDETLILQWQNGELTDQIYSMESARPAENGIPGHQLHFEPDETTDSELVRLIRGMKVTWWNTIAGATETAIVGGSVTVEHMFRANGDEDEPKRIVKFLDHNGGGFRAFHVAALLKVG